MTERSISFICLAVLAADIIQAQDTAAPAFDVASVKPAALSAKYSRAVMSSDAGRITYTTVALGNLIMKAYDLKNYQITGPDWIFTERYDLVATLAAGATEKQIPFMLQTLLRERFQIVMHREQRPLPVYELSAAKGGITAKAAEHPAELRLSVSAKGRKLAGGASFSSLAANLSGLLDRPVVDATGANGDYAIDLEWAPDEREANSLIGRKLAMARESAPPDAGDGAAAPSLTTVLREQLGLKLEPKKSPVEMLIIDQADKIPTRN